MDQHKKVSYLIIINILFVLTSVLIVKVKSEKIRVIIKHFEFDTNPDYIKIVGALRNETDDVVVDVDGDLLHDLGRNIFVQSEALTKIDGKYHTLMKSELTNVCEFLDDPSKEPFLEMFHDNVKKYGNIFDKCPLVKGHYYLKGFKLDFAKLPATTPTGDFKVVIEMSEKNGDTFTKIYKIIWQAVVTKQ